MATRLNVGGPARHIAEVTRASASTHPALVAAGHAPETEGELWPSDLPLLRLPLVREPAPMADLAALAGLRRLLRRHDPAILETHMAKAGAVGRLAARSLSRRPATIHVFHGHVMAGYFSARVERAVVATERALAKVTDALVAVSPEIRDELLDLGVGRPEQWHLIHLGLDLRDYLEVAAGVSIGPLRRALGLSADTPIVGAVGRMAPIKNLDDLIVAVAGLDGVHLALAGDGPDQRRLRALVEDLDVRGRVHFLGLRDDVVNVLAELDVVALSSRNEGTPMALIEALAATRPVVATAVGGVPAVVRDGKTGWLVPPGDPNALRQGLREALANRATAALRAAEGKADVASRFALNRMVEEMTSLYDELIATHGDSRPKPRRR